MAICADISFDGFEGKLAHPEPPPASPVPGVLVMPDAFGISAFSIGQAGRLADLGFIALAGDPYGGGFRASNQEEIAAKFASVVGDQAVLVPGVAWHRVSPAERGPILGRDASLLAGARRCAHARMNRSH